MRGGFAILIASSLLSLPACGPETSDASTESVAPGPSGAEREPEPARPEGERVTLAGDGVRLVGTWWQGERADAVLLFHQLGSERAEWEPVVAALLPLGVSVLTADLRGHGESTLNPAAEGTDAAVLWRQFRNADWARLSDDVGVALAFARTRGANRFVLGGSSIGSSAVIAAAPDHPDVRGVVALSPGRSYRGIHTLGPAGRYSGHLLSIVAEGEAPARETAEALAQTGEHARVRLVPGSAHGMRMIGAFPELPRTVAAFVGEALGDES